MSSNRNRAQHVTWAEGASRLLNVVIALINADRPVDIHWIHKNVAGYGSSLAATRKAFARDREALSSVGIRLTSSRDGELWELDAAETFLPEVDFSAEEKKVLAAATADDPETESAYIKLAGAGVRRNDKDSVVVRVPDLTEIDPASIRHLYRALDHGLQMSFDYFPSAVVEFAQQRTLEPWALGGDAGRLDVTGFDVDRQAQRTFRLARIANIQALPKYGEHPAPEGLSNRELLRQGLSGQVDQVRARVLFRSAGGEELRRHCTMDGDVGSLGPVDRQWLVRVAASHAPDVVVLEPKDVVDDVVAILRHAAEGEHDAD